MHLKSQVKDHLQAKWMRTMKILFGENILFKNWKYLSHFLWTLACRSFPRAQTGPPPSLLLQGAVYHLQTKKKMLGNIYWQYYSWDFFTIPGPFKYEGITALDYHVYWTSTVQFSRNTSHWGTFNPAPDDQPSNIIPTLVMGSNHELDVLPMLQST